MRLREPSEKFQTPLAPRAHTGCPTGSESNNFTPSDSPQSAPLGHLRLEMPSPTGLMFCVGSLGSAQRDLVKAC